MVTGKPFARCAARSSSSHAILSREYCQNGFARGVASVTGSAEGGVSYAEAELIKTYWRVRPRKSSMSS
jgi:hypothetical protein